MKLAALLMVLLRRLVVVADDARNAPVIACFLRVDVSLLVPRSLERARLSPTASGRGLAFVVYFCAADAMATGTDRRFDAAGVDGAPGGHALPGLTFPGRALRTEPTGETDHD